MGINLDTYCTYLYRPELDKQRKNAEWFKHTWNTLKEHLIVKISCFWYYAPLAICPGNQCATSRSPKSNTFLNLAALSKEW